MYHFKTHTTMPTNLIDVLQKSFSDKTYQDISNHVGVNPVSTKNGLKAIIPGVLASILGNNTVSSSKQPVWWNALDNEYPHTEDEVVSSHIISNSTFLVKGREVISGMFRTNHDELVAGVSSIAGIQKEKAAGLIEVGVPLVVGHLKNWMRTKQWKFNDLIKNLTENKATITEALPAGLSPVHFGVDVKSNLENGPDMNKKKLVLNKSTVTNKPEDNFSETIKTEIPPTRKTEKKSNNGLIWVIGLIVVIIVAFLIWYLMGNEKGLNDIKIDTDEMLVPGVKDTVVNIQSYEKVMDGSYYAYKEKSEFVLKVK
jgi:hypothetical protein